MGRRERRSRGASATFSRGKDARLRRTAPGRLACLGHPEYPASHSDAGTRETEAQGGWVSSSRPRTASVEQRPPRTRLSVTALPRTQSKPCCPESHVRRSSPQSLTRHRKSHQLTQHSRMDRGNGTQARRCWTCFSTRAAVDLAPFPRRPRGHDVASSEIVREPRRPSEAPLRYYGMCCVQLFHLRWPRT